jgi:anti-sigma-K factor RskA
MADRSEFDEYEGYEDLVRLGRTLTPEDREHVAPPADLWQKIERAVADDQPPATAHASVTSLAPHRARRRRIWAGLGAAAAAACLLVAVVVARDTTGTRTIGEVALSNNGLDPSGASSSGRAKLVQLDGGTRAIELDVSDLPQLENGYFELWLIDRQLNGMVSMGPVRGSGRFVIPAGVTTDVFAIVDLSIEPVDGVPTHSGKSVLRGELA